MAAVFGAARLSEAGSAGAGCAPTWATSGPRRRKRHSMWRLSSARLWPTGRRPTPTRATLQQASSSTASCGRDIHQTWCGMSQVRTWARSSLGSSSRAWLLMQQQMRHLPGRTRRSSTSRSRSACLPHEFERFPTDP
eukprot:6198961-Pleurochrysis_carterae.AAC.1